MPVISPLTAVPLLYQEIQNENALQTTCINEMHEFIITHDSITM